jgi:hypothetical protein
MTTPEELPKPTTKAPNDAFSALTAPNDAFGALLAAVAADRVDHEERQ